MSRTIKHKKTGGKAVSSHCQNNNACNWCKDNRTIRTKRENLRVNLKSELEHEIDSSDDSMDFFYPEKNEYYWKNYYSQEYFDAYL